MRSYGRYNPSCYLAIAGKRNCIPDPNMEDFAKLQTELNHAGVDFLQIDLETALTMVEIALQAEPNSEKRSRNTANARHAYDTVLNYLETVEASREQRKELYGRLGRLKTALLSLGERL